MKYMTDSMSDLEYVLRSHAERYPFMQPTDAVKLIYQNEFGGGHLIKDEEACLHFLRREYESIKKDATIPLHEEIGNGLVRVNLAAVKEEDLDQLGKDFIRSASEHIGTLESFLNKLSVLKKLTEQGIFSFRTDDLDSYLAEYGKSGYQAVSHSQIYRDTYKPAYRITTSS